MTDYDVVVVGGGPIGALTALTAAETGARVLLAEQGDGTGEPVRCSGLVSPRTLKLYRVSSGIVHREIVGGRLHLPDGTALTLRAEEPRAVAIDRAALDRTVLKQATAAGVEVHTRTRVTHAGMGTVTLNRAETVTAAVIVGADGPGSGVRRWFALPPPQEFIVGRQVVVTGELERPDEVEVFVGSAVAPGGFAWAIPAEPGRLRVGLVVPRGTDVNRLLAQLLETRFPGAVHAGTGGLIPIGPAAHTYGAGVLIVGDAAGQVKPLSGGGLYPGGVSARIAGRIAAQAALAGMTDADHLRVYDRQWRAELERELKFGLTLRQILFSLSDDALISLGTMVGVNEVLQVITAAGDFDYPSKLVPAFLAHRELWPRFLSALGLIGGWDRIQELVPNLFPL